MSSKKKIKKQQQQEPTRTGKSITRKELAILAAKPNRYPAVVKSAPFSNSNSNSSSNRDSVSANTRASLSLKKTLHHSNSNEHKKKKKSRSRSKSPPSTKAVTKSPPPSLKKKKMGFDELVALQSRFHHAASIKSAGKK